jgi:hypothetical protein
VRLAEIDDTDGPTSRCGVAGQTDHEAAVAWRRRVLYDVFMENRPGFVEVP